MMRLAAAALAAMSFACGDELAADSWDAGPQADGSAAPDAAPAGEFAVDIFIPSPRPWGSNVRVCYDEVLEEPFERTDIGSLRFPILRQDGRRMDIVEATEFSGCGVPAFAVREGTEFVVSASAVAPDGRLVTRTDRLVIRADDL